MKCKATIEFFLKPRLCCIAMHTIDFLIEDDKYNPFALANRYASIKTSLDNNVYDKIVDYIMHKDLGQSSFDEVARAHALADVMHLFLKDKMHKKSIEFKKSSKYFMQTAFAKMTVSNSSSTMSFFFQMLGTSSKKKIDFTNIVFLRCIVDSKEK